MKPISIRKELAIAAIIVTLGCTAHAQSYPVRPIRMIVPGPPAGATDILARLVGGKLTESWGQQVVVDNRAGASGIIGTGLTAKAMPDGYTIMMGHAGTHAINVSLYSKLPYDPVKDFAPVILIATAPNVLVVHPSLPVKSVKELIALAKKMPGQLTYASAGIGFAQHLSGVVFSTMAGVEMVHVPYKGSAPGLTDVIGGHVSLMFPNIPAALPHVNAGKLRALGVTTSKRSMVIPDVPTIAEAGLPGYEATPWFGAFAPAGTPREIVNRLNTEIVGMLGQQDVREQMKLLGADPIGSSPEEFASFVKAEITKWEKVVRDSGAKAE